MKRLLKWLWFPDRNIRIVKAISWTEFVMDTEYGQRQRTWIINPGSWLLARLIALPQEAFEVDENFEM